MKAVPTVVFLKYSVMENVIIWFYLSELDHVRESW